MKHYLLIICNFFSITVFNQTSTELIVYSLKGKVTAVENQIESDVKIGKVLKSGTTLKVDKNASLTMICKQGKPLKVYKEGVYSLNNWKDSCEVKTYSLSNNYFKYIWGQFYTHSPEYQEQLKKRNEGAVSRTPTGDNEFKKGKKIKIEFNEAIDTLNIGSSDFPLAWTCYQYSGKYLFCLYTLKKRKLILRDSLFRSYISTEKFRDRLDSGNSYVWAVSAPKAGNSKKRIINVVSDEKIQSLIDELMKPIDTEEDMAAIYFRTAYYLEIKHYLAQAYIYFKKAAEANPGMEVYSDKLTKFRNDFWIQ